METLESKNVIFQIKSSANGFNNRLHTAQERIGQLESILEENIQKEDLKDKKLKFKRVKQKTVRNSNVHEIGISEEKERENESKSITKGY